MTVDRLEVDISPEHMKKVKDYFKDIEHIKVPYSGVEILKMVRDEKKFFPVIRHNKKKKFNGNGRVI